MFQRILVPIDGSPTSMAGLNEAIRLATLTHGRLLLVHAIDDLSYSMGVESSIACASDWAADLRERGGALLARSLAIVEAAGLEAEIVLVDNFSKQVHEHVMHEAHRWNADLIVIGTHGRRGMRRVFLGSAAESIARHATVPVLLVRASADDDSRKKRAAQAPALIEPLFMA